MRKRTIGIATGVIALTGLIATAAPGIAADGSMADGRNGWSVTPIHTNGESYDGYRPPGILDGLGAFELDDETIRVLANHELLNGDGYLYTVDSIDLKGARVSYFDINKETRQIEGSGLAYDKIYDVDGNVATSVSSFLTTFQSPFTGLTQPQGFSRLCSASLFEAEQFGPGRGFADRLFLTGEEDGGFFNSVGGAEWAIDPSDNSIWHLPDLGRGAWENVTVLDTGDPDTVAILLSDDSSPFDFDDDDVREAAPLFLYIGEKDPSGDFPARNGLRGGTLHVWVARDGSTTPLDFNGGGTLVGDWVAIDNSRDISEASADGSTGYDTFGYPTQGNLWLQAEDLGAFGFSRPEDVATNPRNGREAVLASTGVDDYAVDPMTGNGADTFGTMYTIKTNFNSLKANVRIIYDGDADADRRLRSPDNLDWADDGFIYIQEDKAEDQSLTGEPLFGDGAVNPNEASIIRMNKNGARLEQIAEIDRSVILDPTNTDTSPIDQDAGEVGAWETSGIVDVSTLFGEPDGTLFLFDVQAHGIDDQDDVSTTSRIIDTDLKEGGQLSFLEAPAKPGKGRG